MVVILVLIGVALWAPNLHFKSRSGLLFKTYIFKRSYRVKTELFGDKRTRLTRSDFFRKNILNNY